MTLHRNHGKKPWDRRHQGARREDRMSEWNAAITAAVRAIEHAPVFPRNGSNPLVDSQILTILTICLEEVEKLRKLKGSENG